MRGPFLSVLLAVIAMGASADVSGDAERGRQIYQKCAQCHMVGSDARNRMGPVLNRIISARAGDVEDYRYSRAMQDAGTDGLRWTPEALNTFLQAPAKMLPGTSMNFSGLPREADRIDVIAYLETFSGTSKFTEADKSFVLSDDILALEGDVEYGEYLSSECTTCHRTDGTGDGIPSITGWETANFVTAMHAYRQKHRDHPVMQMISGRLTDDEIAALAAYFKGVAK